ncbi:MAG: alanyl-tRNA editing protein [Chloroflexota bacterium]
MMRKVFWDDPYLAQLDTRITDVNGSEITVAETIFYAFSGGQESDAGTIGGFSVREARKDGWEIVYTLDQDHSLQVGDVVPMTIDWERRYHLMRLHFAAEIILELCSRNLPGIEKIGAHIAADKSRIDFLWGESIIPALPLLSQQAADLIEANHPITSAFSDEVNQRRYWEIMGFARVACGGTHLRRTGEVGALRLRRNNIGKGKERVEIYLA